MIPSIKETPRYYQHAEQSPVQQMPSEITLMILQKLSPGDLASATLTCRVWSQIVEGSKKTLWVPYALKFRSFLEHRYFEAYQKCCKASPYKTKSEAYSDIYTDGRSYLKKMNCARKTLAGEISLKINEIKILEEMGFAFSQIGLGSNQHVSDSFIMQQNRLRYIDKLLRNKLPASSVEQFLQKCDMNDQSTRYYSSAIQVAQAIVACCDKNKINEALDLFEKNFYKSQPFYCMGSSIFEKCIELKDRESIQKLFGIISKFMPPDLVSTYIEVTLSSSPKGTKYLFELCKLLKDDPRVTVFGFGDPYRCFDRIESLIDQDCDDDAIRLFKISPLGKEQINSIVELFEAKGLTKKAQDVIRLKKDIS
jgi:hypothetical protein